MMTEESWGTKVTQERPVRTTAYRQAAAKPSTALELPPQAKAEPAIPEDDREPQLWEAVNAAEYMLRWGGTLTKKGAEDYLGWGSDAALHVATMWAVHTQARMPCREADHIEKEAHDDGDPGDLALRVSPRLGLFAVPTEDSLVGEGSGKTHNARLLGTFCANPKLVTEPTAPAVARIMGLAHNSMFLDEAAGYLSNGRHSMSKSIMENGYSRSGLAAMSGSTDRVWGNNLYTIKNFGPVCLVTVSNPQLEGSEKLRPLMSRFIKIRFRQAPSGYRPPMITDEHYEQMQTVAESLQKWMMKAAPMLRSASYEMPDYMSPRTAEIWESLFICAALIDADRAADKMPPVWVPRMEAAARLLVGGQEQQAKVAKDWAAVQAGPWMPGAR